MPDQRNEVSAGGQPAVGEAPTQNQDSPHRGSRG